MSRAGSWIRFSLFPTLATVRLGFDRLVGSIHPWMHRAGARPISCAATRLPSAYPAWRVQAIRHVTEPLWIACHPCPASWLAAASALLWPALYPALIAIRHQLAISALSIIDHLLFSNRHRYSYTGPLTSGILVARYSSENASLYILVVHAAASYRRRSILSLHRGVHQEHP